MKKIRFLTKTIAGISAAAMAFSLVSYVPLNWGTESSYVIEASALEAAKKDVAVLSVYPSGCLKTMSVVFQADTIYGEAYGKIGIQKQQTSMHYLNPYIGSSGAQNPSDWPDTVTVEDFIAFGSGEEFLWSDASECAVTVEFKDGVFNLSESNDYYIYLWTRAPSYGIYPDLLLRKLTTENGKLLDESGNAISTHVHDWAEEWTTNDDYHWHECDAEDCEITEDSLKDGYAEHTYDKEIANADTLKSAASCTSPAVYYKSCVCGKNGTETFEYGEKAAHTPVSADNAQAPTCTEAGKESDIICDVCGETITVGDAIDPTGHDWSTVYSYDKKYHWHECLNENCPVSENSEKDGYEAHISSGPATEDNDEHCTVCGYVITSPLEHVCQNNVLTFVPEVPETCTTDGVREHYVCRCGKLYYDETAIVEATESDLRIPAHHTLNDAWTSNDIQHYHLCTVCGNKIDAAAHTFGDWTITTFATAESDGEKERTCDICSYVQTNVVKYIPDPDDDDTGDITDVTDSDSNACHGDTRLTIEEVIEKFDFTPEELTAVENGADIYVYLIVEDNTETVSESDRALTESVLENSDTAAMYLDIVLLKQIGQNDPTSVPATNGEITIVLEIPEELINYDSNIERTYYIIRVHEGIAEKIYGEFDAAAREFRFTTDKFSSYAIAYKDVDKTAVEEATEAVSEALENIEVTNETTAEEILEIIQEAAGDDVTVEIESIETVPATADGEGSITVTLTITDEYGNTETIVTVISIEKIPEPEKVVYYPIITIGNVDADMSQAKAGQTVNVKAEFGYDIIVTAANGRQIAEMTEKGSFKMPACKVYVKAVQNETLSLMANAWNHSYVYSYDAEMNIIKVNSDVRRGVVVIDLGAEYAGRDFTIYAGRKSTKTVIISGTLDKYGRFTFKADEGRKYTLVVE